MAPFVPEKQAQFVQGEDVDIRHQALFLSMV